MASNDVLLGQVYDADGDPVEVWRNADETVSLISLRVDEPGEDGPALTFAPDGLNAVRELLGRAAMPRQAAPADGVNKVERLARDVIGIPDGL